jgi:hypothetical protein
MRKFLFLLIFIFSVSAASNVLATGTWQSCSNTGPIGSVASVCQDLVKKYGEDYILSHTDAQDENTVVCYGKTEGGSGSPDLVGSACKIDGVDDLEETAKQEEVNQPAKPDVAKGESPKGGTYKLIDPETEEVRRTGRSNDLKKRESDHANAKETKDLRFDVDKRTNNYAEQRGREHAIHEQHPEARNTKHPEGGNECGLNKCRAISPKNKKKDKYLEAEKQRAERDDG